MKFEPLFKLKKELLKIETPDQWRMLRDELLKIEDKAKYKLSYTTYIPWDTYEEERKCPTW